jgi:hypothetical protein
MSYVHESTDAEGQPTQREHQLARAGCLFEAFTGVATQRVATRQINRTMPQVLVDMGALRGLVYTKDHCGTGETYIHFMEDPPRLMCDADGRQLYVLGGSYRVTRRGLEG